MIFSLNSADFYENVFQTAKEMENKGAYKEAALEYKRYLFLQDYSPGKHQKEAFLSLSAYYENNSLWEEAAEYQHKAILLLENNDLNQNESEIANLQINHIKLLKNDANQKQNSLSDNLFIFSYENLDSYSDIVRKAAFYADLENSILTSRWDHFSVIFNKCISLFPEAFTKDEQKIITENLQKIYDFKPKNQTTAAYLSLLPGLGQLYAKDYKDSANAFLLNGSLIALSTYSIITLDLWTFSLLEFSPTIHFMRGNIYNAQKDTYNYNLAEQKKITTPLLKIIYYAENRI